MSELDNGRDDAGSDHSSLHSPRHPGATCLHLAGMVAQGPRWPSVEEVALCS